MAKEASAGPVGDPDLGVHVLDMVAHRFGEITSRAAISLLDTPRTAASTSEPPLPAQPRPVTGQARRFLGASAVDPAEQHPAGAERVAVGTNARGQFAIPRSETAEVPLIGKVGEDEVIRRWCGSGPFAVLRGDAAPGSGRRIRVGPGWAGLQQVLGCGGLGAAGGRRPAAEFLGRVLRWQPLVDQPPDRPVDDRSLPGSVTTAVSVPRPSRCRSSRTCPFRPHTRRVSAANTANASASRA